MTRIQFVLTAWTRPLFALVAPHGLTDLSQAGVLERYACWLVLPMPSTLITLLFCLASVVHLSSDVGADGSLFVHALVYEVHRLLGPQAAFNAFLVYFALMHTPNHYHTETVYGNTRFVKLGLLCSAALLLPCACPLHDGFVLTDELQRLVIAHIVTTLHAARARANANASLAARRFSTRRAPFLFAFS